MKYKDLAFRFYMLHEEFPITIDFRNGITFWGIDEGDVKGREAYRQLMSEARQVFGHNSPCSNSRFPSKDCNNEKDGK